MEKFSEYAGFVLAFILPGAVLFLFLNILWRKIRGKSTFSSGTTFVGEHIYKIWETGQHRTSVEEVQYQREEEREEAEPGEPPESGDPDSR